MSPRLEGLNMATSNHQILRWQHFWMSLISAGRVFRTLGALFTVPPSRKLNKSGRSPSKSRRSDRPRSLCNMTLSPFQASTEIWRILPVPADYLSTVMPSCMSST